MLLPARNGHSAGRTRLFLTGLGSLLIERPQQGSHAYFSSRGIFSNSSKISSEVLMIVVSSFDRCLTTAGAVHSRRRYAGVVAAFESSTNRFNFVGVSSVVALSAQLFSYYVTSTT